MEFDHRIQLLLAAERAETLRADYGPSRPLRLRLGLRLLALGERLTRPYGLPAPARVTYARVR